MTGLIYEALANVMADVSHVAKDDRNDHQNFNFRGIDAVVNAVGPILRQHRVTVMPTVHDVAYDDVTTSQGKASTACRVVVGYTFAATDGSELTTVVAGEAWDTGDKATPKAMSVAFRTALLQALALPTDEPDPDSHTYERSAADLSELNDLIAQAKAAGVEGDYDATLEWASQHQTYADKACETLRAKLASSAPAGGEAEASPAGDQPAADSPSGGSAQGDAPSPAPSEGGDDSPVAAPATSPSPPSDTFDWQAHAQEQGVTKVVLLKAFVDEWPDLLARMGDEHAKRLPPRNSKQIDAVAADYPGLVRDLIDRHAPEDDA